jgi:hypothetical protein
MEAEQMCFRQPGELVNKFSLLFLLIRNQKLEKVIPDTPAGETPVHLKKRQTYSHHGP